jgi:hypothetical protein
MIGNIRSDLLQRDITYLIYENKERVGVADKKKNKVLA